MTDIDDLVRSVKPSRTPKEALEAGEVLEISIKQGGGLETFRVGQVFDFVDQNDPGSKIEAEVVSVAEYAITFKARSS